MEEGRRQRGRGETSERRILCARKKMRSEKKNFSLFIFYFFRLHFSATDDATKCRYNVYLNFMYRIIGARKKSIIKPKESENNDQKLQFDVYVKYLRLLFK